LNKINAILLIQEAASKKEIKLELNKLILHSFNMVKKKN